MTKTSASDLMFSLLGWGSGDVSHVCGLMDDFDIDFDPQDVDWSLKGVGGLNQTIYRIFEEAVRSVGAEMDGKRIDCYTNSIDSHLCVDDEEVFDLNELRDAVKSAGIVTDEEEGEYA